MSFFSKKNKFSYTVLISLKSSSIDLQLIKTDQSNKKEVLFVKQHTMLVPNSQDFKAYTDQYIKELNTVLQEHNLAIKQITGNQDMSVYILLHTPWFTSSIDSLFYKDQIVLDEGFIKKEFEQIQAKPNLRTIEKQIIKIKTNGYVITDIHDISCSNVEINVYSSYISNEIHTHLIQQIKTYFPTASHPQFCTSPLMMLDNIKQFLIQEDNVIFLTVGSEITEIGIIEDDALSNFSTFPIGIHDFLKTIGTSIKSYDYDLLYQKQVTIKDSATQAQFEALKQSWLTAFIQALQFFKTHTPHKIILVTDSKAYDFFATILLDSIKSNDSNTLKNYRIINFDISALKDIITYKTPIGENELQITLEALI